jgi:hypothetical protein
MISRGRGWFEVFHINIPLRVFGKRVLRRKFGPKRVEIGGW